MFEAVGAIALTLLLGWVAFVFGAIALMALGGFDEVNIPVGLIMLALCFTTVAGWWFVVGTHIMIGIS